MRFVSSDMSSTRGGQTSTQRMQPLQVSMSIVTVAGWRGIVPSRNTQVPEGQRRGGSHPQAATRSAAATCSAPRVMQSVFVSISFRRCGGSTSPSAACSDATATTPVVATSAPSAIMLAPIGCPIAFAISVAGTGTRLIPSHTGGAVTRRELKTSTPPGSAFLPSAGSPSGCMASRAQADGTIGGVTISRSAMTTVDSLEPPRIIPMKRPNIMTCLPSPMAACASSLATSWMPCPPMPVMMITRSTRARLAPPARERQRGNGRVSSGRAIDPIAPELWQRRGDDPQHEERGHPAAHDREGRACDGGHEARLGGADLVGGADEDHVDAAHPAAERVGGGELDRRAAHHHAHLIGYVVCYVGEHREGKPARDPEDDGGETVDAHRCEQRHPGAPDGRQDGERERHHERAQLERRGEEPVAPRADAQDLGRVDGQQRGGAPE